MDNNDTILNKADVTKWKNLIPVFTYGSPDAYETYEWFQKDAEGRWVSGDPFKKDDARYAGTGPTPEQSVIPKEVAEEFLSKDGMYWQAWREVDKAEAVPGINVFRIMQKFAYPTATLSMRIDFNYTYQQALITRLLAAKLPGVFIDKLGGTPERRRLQIIRLEDQTSQLPPNERKTVLMIAKEHPTEPAASWLVYSALATLIANTPEALRLRKDTTWLLIPIQDPDGSANSIFDQLTEGFLRPNDPDLPPEILAYARYFTKYVASCRIVDLTLSLHSVEANESKNLFCPFRDEEHDATVRSFNRLLFADLTARGYSVNDPDAVWGTGVVPARLYGWCAARFGSVDLCFEVNDRYPEHRLNLAELQGIGSILTSHLANWLASDEGKRSHTALLRRGEEYRQARETYFLAPGRNVLDRTPYEMLILGY